MWEYARIHGLSGDVMATLNELGRDGWELVLVFQDHLYFKKPIKPPPRRKPAKPKGDK